MTEKIYKTCNLYWSEETEKFFLSAKMLDVRLIVGKLMGKFNLENFATQNPHNGHKKVQNSPHQHNFNYRVN